MAAFRAIVIGVDIICHRYYQELIDELLIISMTNDVEQAGKAIFSAIFARPFLPPQQQERGAKSAASQTNQ